MMNTNKQIITAICLVLAAALLCVQTASAGSMNAGDSFDTATQIESGFYEDEITDDEEKYSYIEIKPGQEFILETTTDECSDAYARCQNVRIFNKERSQIGELGYYDYNGKTGYFSFSTSSKKDSYRFYIRTTIDYLSSGKSGYVKYHTSISIKDHFDANSETDVGDNFNDALSISPGNYEGYLSRNRNSGNDRKDCYSMSIQSGDKSNIALTPSDEDRLILSIYNEDRECVKTEESKETGSIARTQWLADSSQNIYIIVEGGTDKDGGEYSLDITTGKASKNERQIPLESDPESESEPEEQPGFESLISLISLVGVYIGLKKK